jgi:hypothetical protein
MIKTNLYILTNDQKQQVLNEWNVEVNENDEIVEAAQENAIKILGSTFLSLSHKHPNLKR